MKRIQVIFLISGGIALLSVVIVLFSVFRGPDAINFNGRSFEEIIHSEDWVPVVVIPLVFIITLGSLASFYRVMFPMKIKNGEPARATVLKVWDTGTTINDNPQIGLQLEVVTREGRRFQAETKTIVSRLNAALVQPGVSAEVIYDPQNLKRVQVTNIEVSANTSDDSVESRLAQIASLRDKGLITETEYQKKREEIIKSI